MVTKQEIDLNRGLTHFCRESNAAIQLACESGVQVDLTQWLTIKRYAQRYGLTTQVVTNWIARGIIPAECTMSLPELNNLRLVKNQPYR